MEGLSELRMREMKEEEDRGKFRTSVRFVDLKVGKTPGERVDVVRRFRFAFARYRAVQARDKTAQ
jgi:hypothetical protein